MPYINGRGDFCHGVGGSYFNINNKAICRGAAIGWMDDDNAALANGDDGAYGGEFIACGYHVPTGAFSRLSNPPTGSNSGYAGGGYAAWWWGPDTHLPLEIRLLGGLRTNAPYYPKHDPVAGILGMGPDGSFGYKPDYQSNGPTMVRRPDATQWQLTPNHAYDLQLLGGDRAIFRDSAMGLQVRGLPMPTFLPGGVWAPYAFELQGKWWVGYYSGSCGLVAHPFDSLNGWSIVPKGDAWGAFRAIGNKLCVVWSNGQAEQAGQLTPLWLDPAVNAVSDLTPPPVVVIPPPPPLAGKVSIGSWGPATGTAPLTVATTATWSGDVARIQWLRAKAGGPWVADSDPRDPRVDPDHHMTFDAGRYVVGVRGLAADGTVLDETGRSRAVEAINAAPPPPQDLPLKTLERYWLSPNINSTDLAEALQADLSTVDVFGLPVQWFLEDERYAKLDLTSLHKQGVNLAIEMGSIKPLDYHAEKAQSDLARVAERVKAKGHQVSYLVMDEPLTATLLSYDAQGKLISLDKPVQPFDESAFSIAKFVQKARETMPGVKVLWAEAFPNISLETMRQCLMHLDSWGCHLDGWHLDIDWHRAKKEGVNPFDAIRLAKQYADDYKAQLGVYLTGYPHATDAEYYSEVVAMAKDLHAEAAYCIDHVLVESWAGRTGTDVQDLPANLGPSGLIALFNYIRTEIFS